MEMKAVYLVATLVINGNAVAGETKDGWGPRKMADMETCQQIAKKANEYNKKRDYKVTFSCENRPEE